MSTQRPDANIVILTGYLEATPSHRVLPGGLPVANAKLISQSHFLSTDKARAVNAINLAFYGPAADWCRDLNGHDPVYVQGELVIRSTSTTSQRTTTEVVVRSIRKLATDSDAADTAAWG